MPTPQSIRSQATEANKGVWLKLTGNNELKARLDQQSSWVQVQVAPGDDTKHARSMRELIAFAKREMQHQQKGDEEASHDSDAEVERTNDPRGEARVLINKLRPFL